MPVDWMDDIHQEVAKQRKVELLVYKMVRYITEMTTINKDTYQKCIMRGHDDKKYGTVRVGHYIIGIGEGYERFAIADEDDLDVYDIDRRTAYGLLNMIKQQKAMILGGMMYGEEAE